MASSAFHRHLSFFARTKHNQITFYDSLCGNLVLGLNFPVSVVLAVGQQVLYGNIRSFIYGPFRGIDVSAVKSTRSQLGAINTEDVDIDGLTKRELSVAVQAGSGSLLDRLSAFGLWTLAAQRRNGRVSKRDLELYREGALLPELERRRKDSRDDVLPLLRGGPGSVAGHSWFVEKLFGVKVYQTGSRKQS